MVVWVLVCFFFFVLNLTVDELAVGQEAWERQSIFGPFGTE